MFHIYLLEKLTHCLQKRVKTIELYSKVFENAANSEAALHAHLTLFEEENIKKQLNLTKDLAIVNQLVY